MKAATTQRQCLSRERQWKHNAVSRISRPTCGARLADWLDSSSAADGSSPACAAAAAAGSSPSSGTVAARLLAELARLPARLPAADWAAAVVSLESSAAAGAEAVLALPPVGPPEQHDQELSQLNLVRGVRGSPLPLYCGGGRAVAETASVPACQRRQWRRLPESMPSMMPIEFSSSFFLFFLASSFFFDLAVFSFSPSCVRSQRQKVERRGEEGRGEERRGEEERGAEAPPGSRGSTPPAPASRECA